MLWIDLIRNDELKFADVSECAKAVKVPVDLDDLFNEVVYLNQKLSTLKADTNFENLIQLWSKIFQVEGFRLKNIYEIVSFILSIPASNAFPERIFSVTQNLWTGIRNRLDVESVGDELITFFNYDMDCVEFAKFLQHPDQKPLLRLAKSNQKYISKSKKSCGAAN